MLNYLFYGEELLVFDPWLKNYHCVNYPFVVFSIMKKMDLRPFCFIKIIQGSVRENGKSNITCIAIKLHYFQYSTVEGKKPLKDNLQQGFGQ